MEYWTIGFEVEAFDVKHTAVARLHDHRYLTFAGCFAHEELHVERVTLFDDEVESVQKLPEILWSDARGFDDDP
jgi:hypothetical protein